MIDVMYQCRDEGPGLVNHERTITTHQEACELIDNYPWVEEAEFFEKYGEGGGLFFSIGEPEGKHALFQLTPMSETETALDLSIVMKKGLLGVFGRQEVDKNFNVVSVQQAKMQLKELFGHSIDSLYAKYK